MSSIASSSGDVGSAPSSVALCVRTRRTSVIVCMPTLLGIATEYTSTPPRPSCLRVSQTGVRPATHRSIRLHPSFHDTDPRPQDHRYVRKGDHRHRLLITIEDARAKNAVNDVSADIVARGMKTGKDPPSYPPPLCPVSLGGSPAIVSSVSRPLIRAARHGPLVFLDHRRHWT